MRIIITGASSFTGYWFVRELAANGHEVLAVFRRKAQDYDDDPCRSRVARLHEVCRVKYGISFGEPAFVSLVERDGPWDAYCHHAAQVGDYRSPNFDVVAALSNNTRNLPTTLAALVSEGCRRVVLTGSYFEEGEGAGSGQVGAVSPYGLSKSLTAEVFRFYAERAGVRLGKFIIPNPFGPYEEQRFSTYLMRRWFARELAIVNTPEYVRDNIQVSLLAKAYNAFVSGLPSESGFSRINPSGYVEAQAAFAARYAGEMRARLDLPCDFYLEKQVTFLEPRVRINTDPTDPEALGWNESRAWDDIAEYYGERLAHDCGQTRTEP